MIYNLLQFAGGLILACGYFPQILQILRTGSVHDLNLKTYSLIFVGILFMEIYAINLVHSNSGHMFLVTNTISLFVSFVMVCLILKYRR